MSPTVYIPRPIRTVEDAERLPVGTVAQCHSSDGTVSHACLRVEDGWWCTNETNVDGTPFLVPHVGMIGDTALVPVEATEVYGARDKAGAVSRADAGTVDPRAQLEKHIAERRALGHADTLVSRPVLLWEAVEEA